MSHSVAVQCDRCGGTGRLVTKFSTGDTEGNIQPCGTCLGQGHLLVDAAPVPTATAGIPHPDFARAIAMLSSVVAKIPYGDRKRLETEIADALFKGEVDPAHKTAWEGLVADIQRVEGT